MGEMADELCDDGFFEWLLDGCPAYDAACFADALRRGVWRTGDGEEIPISRMTNMHLLNALRRCAAFQHPDAYVLTRLNAEWCRRGFAPNAWAENHHVRVRWGKR